jgi:hypothetical protein
MPGNRRVESDVGWARFEIVGANVVEEYIWYLLVTGDGLIDSVIRVRSFALIHQHLE